MDRDPVRQKIKDLMWKNGLNMREASLAIGRNPAYMHQFLERGIPKALTFQDSTALAGRLGCDEAELRHKTIPKRKTWTRKPREKAATIPAAGLAFVPEMEVEAAAGLGALNEEFVSEKARWYLPEGMIRHEADAKPEGLRIMRVRGNSMEPDMSEDDRIVVDTARRIPATGEMFVLWDGNGLVVKRVETLREPGPSRLRLISANPDYTPYTCLAEDAHIVGKVVWALKRM